jgi:putative nucleotidyltransferase with HDIG domain
LIVGFHSPHEFPEDQKHLLTTIAEIAGNAIHRMKLYDQTRRQLQQLSALHQIDLAITGSPDIDNMLQILLNQVITQLRVDAACVLIVDRNQPTLESVASRGFATDALRNTRLRFGEGYAGRAALDQRTIYIPDLKTRLTDYPPSPFFEEEGFVSYLAVPLVAKNEVKGVLEIFHRSPLQQDPEWLDFLEALTSQAAIVIGYAKLLDDLQRSNIELNLAYDSTIEGWSRALEMRDRETQGHSQRVAEMTLRLAKVMGLPEPDLVHIRRGALLHDIGKLGVPDSILLKDGSLNEEERDLIRKHPTIAYEMLAPITYLRLALDIPYYHHEKWNGSGYPRGLKGEDIPLAARIFAVVDVWDALTSDRPYRKAWSEAESLAYIQEQAGEYFDPQVVDAFLLLMGDEKAN